LTDNDVDGLPAIVEGPPQIESVLYWTLFLFIGTAFVHFLFKS
jgi:hypothetical protein